jgi:UDP-glucose:(heptosyl)LPS alpha-1,3-glucosyltransferase
MKTITLLKSTINHLGGLEKYTLRLAQTFHEKGHPVRLITTGYNGTLAPLEGVDISSFDFRHKISPLKVLQFDAFCKNTLAKTPSDVTFGLDRNTEQTHLRAGNGVHLCYLLRRKQLEGQVKSLSLSLNPLHRVLLSIEKHSFEDKDLKVLFTNSHMVKNEILSHYRVDEKKIQVIHNGVEWTQMKSAFEESFMKKQAISQRLTLDPSTYHFLFLGHNFARKGLSLVLEGMSLIKEKDFHLSVVGYDKDMELFKRKAYALGLSSKVTFWGASKDALSFYQLADCLVLPSHYDPFANVTVEALSMGLYVITSSSNGASEVVQDFAGDVIKDLSSKERMQCALTRALDKGKTKASAQKIRDSIAHLDFPHQLDFLYGKIISTS